MENINIRELIKKTPPPFDWDVKGHPVKEIGYYFYGIGDGFTYDDKKLIDADENILWKLHALISAYWLENYQIWNRRSENVIFNMRNKIIIKQKDIGKDMLSVYEERFDWRF